MAAKAHSKIARIPHPSDAALGNTTRDWEADICDLHDVADITTILADEFLTSPENNGNYSLTARQARVFSFAIYDLSHRIERFKDTYYEAIELK